MFSKRRNRLEVNATNSYLVEMARAILKDQLGTDDVYFVQTTAVWGDEEDAKEEIKQFNRHANQRMVASFSIYFAAIDHTRRHGREGQFPILPEAIFNFVLVNEANGWRNWRIFEVRGSWKNFYDPKTEGAFTLSFTGDADVVKTPLDLLKLEQELVHRRPASFKEK